MLDIEARVFFELHYAILTMLDLPTTTRPTRAECTNSLPPACLCTRSPFGHGNAKHFNYLRLLMPLMPLLGQSGTTFDAHIASLSVSIALLQFPLLALLDFRFICSGY